MGSPVRSDVHRGIKIEVYQNLTRRYSVSFSNEPGNFNPIDKMNKGLQSFACPDVALIRARDYIDEHQWEFFEVLRGFTINLRLWWNNKWMFGLHSELKSVNCDGYNSRQDAIYAARAKVAEIEEEDELPTEDGQ